ncbi:MAG: DUF1698 domain-containing protein [Bauldia sp.]|nr:DUF1698 domain-containing protein [Bauldia sp.]
MTPEQVQRAESADWFHAIDLGSHATAGRFPDGTIPQNVTLFGVMDLLPAIDVSNADCLDIGTADGLSAFHMAMRGGRVTATDRYDSVPTKFELAREVLGLDVDYRTGILFDNILDDLPAHAFDVIVSAGVMYHMFHPFDAVLKARKLARPYGFFLIETAFLPTVGQPFIEFNPASGRNKEVTTYWMPSKSALLGMLRFAGFDILAVRTMIRPNRITVLARSVPLGEVSGLTPREIEMQRQTTDAGFTATFPDTRASSVSISDFGEYDVEIDWNTYKPHFPPHPDGSKPIIGKRHLATKTS